jgi:hypothetical protein
VERKDTIKEAAIMLHEYTLSIWLMINLVCSFDLGIFYLFDLKIFEA